MISSRLTQLVIDVATSILVATPVVGCYVVEPLFGHNMSLVELMSRQLDLVATSCDSLMLSRPSGLCSGCRDSFMMSRPLFLASFVATS